MRAVFPILSMAVFAAACGGSSIVPHTAPGVTLSSITVTSKSFVENGRIPIDNTCDGKDVSPQFTWSSPPEGTRSLVLVVDDADAIAGTFTHMIVFNVSPEARFFPEGSDLSTLGPDARFGLNDLSGTHYSGPCPPRGEGHRYRFVVIALDKPLDVAEGAQRAQIDAAMDKHILGEGSLLGVFGH